MSGNRKSSCFHKLLTQSSIDDNTMLKIPNKFVKKFGDDLSSVARLIIPSGLVWLVGLEKTGKKMWFHDGWQVFVKYYSITAGYFLIFKYEGKSNFNVYIFDLTAAEIDYLPKTPTTFKEHDHDRQCPMIHEKEMEDDDSVEILGSFHPCLPQFRLGNKSETSDTQSSFWGKTREENQLLIAYSDFSMDAEELMAENPLSQDMDDTFDGTGQEIHCHSKDSKNDELHFLDWEESTGCELLVRHEEAGEILQTDSRSNMRKAILIANLFKSDNPICRVIMRDSYMHSWSSMHIPCEFAAKYLSESTYCVTLEVSDRGEWNARCIFKDGRASLGKGWHEFVLGNNLKKGDVCVFELLDRMNALLKVTIYRHDEIL